MSNRLLWAAAAVIIFAAAIIYVSQSMTTDQPSNERPSPHAINQGNG
ncbi:hypothetical protein ABID16_003870 [Rhizobium aquaticum]|uniref:Uncharacterized protein n=1 Tax=Rhizobium aquaticum TaxID=1549636 RepID=A0ABV2J434_9HYPH